MTYLGIREWEWMLRTAAQPIPDVDEGRGEEPEDDFSDIWQNSRSGRNPAAEQWLNNRVRYERGDTSVNPLSPHNWVGRADEDLPHGDLQHDETNRSIDDSHSDFLDAMYRGGNDEPDFGQFSLAGPRTEEYEPTSDERLKSDEGWLLGPGKQFDYPGGREAIEVAHNGMHSRGFDLHNIGTDENPIPAYIHRETGANISPIHHSDSVGWQMKTPFGTTEHSSAATAATAHAQGVKEQADAEAERWLSARQPGETSERSYPSQNRSRNPSGNAYRRESPGYIPKTKAQGMSWGNLFDQAIHGDDGYGREFERASVKSEHNPFRGATGRLYGVHHDQWDQDFQNSAAGRGKVAQAIYHYETPIAWKYHSVQPDGTYDEGKWRVPATSFGSAGWFSTGRVQNLMSQSISRADHEHLRDPLVDHGLHRAMEQGGIHRSSDQTYSSVDAQGNSHHIAPSQSGQTAVHTVTSQDGRQQFQKRVPVLEAAQTAFQMTQAPGVGGPPDAAIFLKNKKYRQTVGATPRRRNSSVLSWSDFLRG